MSTGPTETSEKKSNEKRHMKLKSTSGKLKIDVIEDMGPVRYSTGALKTDRSVRT